MTIAVLSLWLSVGGAYMYSQRNARNDVYEVCTTRAYGWPYPWKIENCECDGKGGLTELDPSAHYWNGGIVLLSALVAAGCFRLLLKACL